MFTNNTKDARSQPGTGYYSKISIPDTGCPAARIFLFVRLFIFFNRLKVDSNHYRCRGYNLGLKQVKDQVLGLNGEKHMILFFYRLIKIQKKTLTFQN